MPDRFEEFFRDWPGVTAPSAAMTAATATRTDMITATGSVMTAETDAIIMITGPGDNK